MRGESQVEIAFLILLTAAYYSDIDANSELIGEAAGCSPVIVRRIYKRLKEADLLDTKPGRYGLHLTREADEITVLDITEAVRPLDAASVFGVHAPLSGTTPIADGLFAVLQKDLNNAIDNMRKQMGLITLQDIASEFPSVYDIPPEEGRTVLKQYMKDAEKRHRMST